MKIKQNLIFIEVLSKSSQFSLQHKSKFSLDLPQVNEILRFLNCSNFKNLSIHVLFTTVGLKLTKLGTVTISNPHMQSWKRIVTQKNPAQN